MKRLIGALALAGALLPLAARAQVTEDADDAPRTSPPAASPANANRAPQTIWQAGTGLSYSSGDYGRAVDTQVVAAAFNLRVRRGGWSLRAATSYVSIEGPATVIDTDNGEGTADGGETGGAPSATRSGFGDVSLTLARQFDLADTTRLTGEVRLKLPTGSESKRLSTGTTDLTVRARLSQEVGDVSLRASLQRRFAGGGGRVVVRDTWGASAGASLDLGNRIIAGADLNWQQSAYAGSNANTSLTAFLSLPLTARLRATGYGSTGLTSNSADVTVGASITLRLD